MEIFVVPNRAKHIGAVKTILNAQRRPSFNKNHNHTRTQQYYSLCISCERPDKIFVDTSGSRYEFNVYVLA